MGSRFPQTFDKVTTLRFHLSFLVALLPVVAVSAFFHGWTVLIPVGVSMAGAVGFDELLRWIQKTHDPRDWRAPLWGLLLALILPAQVPWYLPLLGSAFAILVVKGVVGGGATPWLNPVLAAWAFLQVGWPSAFPGLAPISGDHRTPFDVQGTDWLNANLFSWFSIQLPGGYLDLLSGIGHPGTALIAESGSVVLLAATVYLLAKGYFPWQLPAVYFLSFCAPMALSGGNVLYHVFSGAFLMNLFFLASDPSIRPLSRWGVVAFALGAGLVSFLVRVWGVNGDGVGYAVLLMNLFVPWIDQKFRPKSLNDFRLA